MANVAATQLLHIALPPVCQVNARTVDTRPNTAPFTGKLSLFANPYCLQSAANKNGIGLHNLEKRKNQSVCTFCAFKAFL